MKHLIELTDFNTDEITEILNRADQLYDHWKDNSMPGSLKGKKVALWFFGNGFRNRTAFEIGARALGADVSFIPGELGIHEPIDDIGFYLKNWFDMAVIRCRNHKDLLQISKNFNKPVINARTDYNHPCEIIGDLQYIRRQRGSIDELNVVFVGEVTNLCTSWFNAAVQLPISVIQVAPEQYLLPSSQLEKLNRNAKGSIQVSTEINSSITKATDLIYTDCWPSHEDTDKIRDVFLPYQITEEHLCCINQNGFFLPCPPVTKGQEVSAKALLSPLYQNYPAKEFLLHSQNAVMEYSAE